MRIIKLLTFISIILGLLSCQQNQTYLGSVYNELVKSNDSECDKENLQVISILAELGKFRSSNEQPFSQEDDKTIRNFVEKLKSKTDLFDFARLTMILRRNSSSDECFKSKLEET